jgi:hypothetical protein
LHETRSFVTNLPSEFIPSHPGPSETGRDFVRVESPVEHSLEDEGQFARNPRAVTIDVHAL